MGVARILFRGVFVEDVFIFVQEQMFLVGALVLLVFAFYRKETAGGGVKLSTSQVVQAMNAETAILLDVRDSKDFDQGHVTNAINIPHAKVADSLKQLEKHREKQIIVTDNVGQHAASVSKLLAKAGFNIALMRGGMSEWKGDGLPVVK
jgi:rhodanese-related sulfurtransferase